jgi:hypothetical protein
MDRIILSMLDPHVIICTMLLSAIKSHLQLISVNFIKPLWCEREVFNLKVQLLTRTPHICTKLSAVVTSDLQLISVKFIKKFKV